MEKGKSVVSDYTEYRPHGENLVFMREFADDISSSEVFFAETVRALGYLGGVVRPTRADLRLSCAYNDTWVQTDEAHPSKRYWEILEHAVPETTEFGILGPPAASVRVDVLTDKVLCDVYRQALAGATCPEGYFVMFDQVWLGGFETRVVDVNESASGGKFPVTLWGDDLVLDTYTADDGATWLCVPPEDFPAYPPVTFGIDYDTVPLLTLAVHWSRWMEKGTGEHELLQSALDALIADGWVSTMTPTYFRV